MTMTNPLRLLLAAVLLLLAASPAMPQSANDQAALANLADPAKDTQQLVKKPAKLVFGAARLPAQLKPQAIGGYAKGCLAGGEALPFDGPHWQVMRKSRNRNWAHPAMISLVERLATDAHDQDGWNGLLVGDMAQPRGGPMLSGHASHQIGLDADVWLTPMPDHTLTDKERETISATSVVKDRKSINPKVWTESMARLIRTAANYPEVARIFVHPPIKAELCRWATGDRAWLAKVRPYYGHNYHFHIRIKCPKDSPGCKNQATPAPKDGTGCGEELAYWMGDIPWKPAKPVDPNAPKPKPAPPLTLAGLPAECRAVVTAP
jgi:penicillin-insensitive murein endopeptidase